MYSPGLLAMYTVLVLFRPVVLLWTVLFLLFIRATCHFKSRTSGIVAYVVHSLILARLETDTTSGRT